MKQVAVFKMTGEAPRKINLTRIAHAYYKYSDFKKALVFLNDFGFTEEKRVSDDKIYFRGYGTEPWVICAIKADKDEFGGAGFVVDSEEDLQYASETLPKASKIYELTDAPGGGKCVTFHDPVDGYQFHLVYGQESASMLDIPLPQEPTNYVSALSPAGNVNCFRNMPQAALLTAKTNPAHGEEQTRQQVPAL